MRRRGSSGAPLRLYAIPVGIKRQTRRTDFGNATSVALDFLDATLERAHTRRLVLYGIERFEARKGRIEVMAGPLVEAIERAARVRIPAIVDRSGVTAHAPELR